MNHMNSQMARCSNGDAKPIIGDGINLGAALEVVRRFFDEVPALQQRICGIENTPEYVAAKLTIERLTTGQ